ncbi:hypothetical protein JW964_15270 [candidate division KSB1 bacterium]|nr:hypothetical protein [candidate division KSB1 bacterium]
MKKVMMVLGMSILVFCIGFLDELKADGPKVGAAIRFVYSNLSGDSYDNRISSFDLRHVRPTWSGDLMDGKLKCKVVLGFDKNFQKPQVVDAFGEYQVAKGLNIRFGQYKVPFDRQFLTPFWATQFVELGTGDLKPFERDRGVTVRGDFSKGLLAYDVGIFNGNGTTTNYNSKNKNGNDKQGHLYSGRVSINPQGNYGYNLALPGKVNEFKSTIGFACAAGQMNDDTEDVLAYSVDVAARGKGFTSLFEYQNHELKTAAKNKISGYTLEAGYFFTNKLESVGRFSDKKVKNGIQTTEMTVGLNYYFDENNAKLQFNVCHFTNKSTSAVKNADNRIYLLYQIVL